MPIPFLVAGALALVVGKAIHKRGQVAGYNRGVEESKAQLTRLRELLSENQATRESVKDTFAAVMKDMTAIDVKDGKFFNKIANALHGYTKFHVFTMTILSYSRYLCVKLNLDISSSDDLKNIVLGLVQSGFPENLKDEIREIWRLDDIALIGVSFQKYKKKLPEELMAELSSTATKIQEIVTRLKSLMQSEDQIRLEIKRLEAA